MKNKIFSALWLIAGSFLLGFGIDYSSFFAVIPGLIMIIIGMTRIDTTDSK